MELGKILIVEDESIVALNLKRSLTALGYKVVGSARSGSEALDIARRTPPDLVLMDIHIEGAMDGIETATHLWDEMHLRVVYLTAFSEDCTLGRARATQPYGFLLKPYSDRELHATLVMALEQRSAECSRERRSDLLWHQFSAAKIGSWELSKGWTRLHTQRAASELLGVADAAQRGLNGIDALLNCTSAENRALLRSFVDTAAHSNSPVSIDIQFDNPEHSHRCLRLVAFNGGGISEAAPHLVGLVQDLREGWDEEPHLFSTDEAGAIAGAGLFVLDAARRLINANPAFFELTKIDQAKASGLQLDFLSADALTPTRHDQLWRTLHESGNWNGEISLHWPNASHIPVGLSISAIGGALDEEQHFIGVLSNLSPLRKAQSTLEHLANHEPVTGLDNRALMHRKLELAVKRASQCHSSVALILIDIDNFQRINETRGQAVGDAVLREVGVRLTRCARPIDSVSCLGGDQFALILQGSIGKSFIIATVEKLRLELTSTYEVNGEALHIGISSGIAVHPEDGTSPQELLQHADTAMSHGKARGRNTDVFYDREMTLIADLHMNRYQQLRNAMANNELRVYYQPQIDASSCLCRSVEALLRWQHPERGLLPAGDIISAAEESGLIVDIGRWVLREACQQAQRWLAQGMPRIRVAVNVSAVQMRAGALAAEVADALQYSNLPPSLLEIEITESALQNEAIAIATTRQLHEMGVAIAIDDFGTGYSSLSSLKELSVDRLKIDQSFVRDLPTNERDVAIVESILAIAHRMGLKVTAEGVEQSAQGHFLHSRGCDDLQGWLYSRAVAPEQIPQLVEKCWAID